MALLGLIPVVGDIIDPVSEAFFDMIFYMRGAPITRSTKLIITSVIGVALGFIPFIGDFISDIGELSLKIYFIRKEDKKFNKELAAAQALKQRQLRLAEQEEYEQEENDMRTQARS